jgi:hypothetical protein
LQTLSFSQVPTSRGQVNKWTTRVTQSSLAGELMVSNYYHYSGRPQPVTPAILHEMDARARTAGCANGVPPRRGNISAQWSSANASTYRIIIWYSCR